MKKVAIECIDKEQGKRIINYLISLGADNKRRYLGNSIGKYYYVTNGNYIEQTSAPPIGYSTITLPKLEQYSLIF